MTYKLLVTELNLNATKVSNYLNNYKIKGNTSGLAIKVVPGYFPVIVRLHESSRAILKHPERFRSNVIH